MLASPLLGINYGNHYQSGLPYSAVAVNNDLTAIWNMGFRRIRIGAGDLSNTNLQVPTTSNAFWLTRLATAKQIALDAKAMGFYVVFTVTGTFGLNNTTWPTYVSNVKWVGDWAWNNGSPLIDEYQIGNELELINSGPTQLATKIKDLATDVKTNNFHSDGQSTFISIEIPQGSSLSWPTIGMGDLDLIGGGWYNSGSGSFDAEAVTLVNKYGKKKIYFGEWNVNSNWPFTGASITNQCENIDEECVQLWTRLQKIIALGIPAYFFTYRWDQNGDAFSLFNSATGQYRKWTDVLFDRPRLEATDTRRKDLRDHGSSLFTNNTATQCRSTELFQSLSPGTPYTLSLWIYPIGLTGAPRIYEENSSGANGSVGNFSMQLSGQAILMNLSTSTGSKIAGLSAQDLKIRMNQWNHIVWVDNVGKATVYVNNARGLRPYNYTPSGTYLTDQHSIGIERVANQNTFNGRIDEVAIYPIAINGAQRRRMFEQGDSFIPGVTPRLYLKFDEGSGTLVSDSSGNGHNFNLASATGAWVAHPADGAPRTALATSRTKTTASRSPIKPAVQQGSKYRPIWSGMGMNYGNDTNNGVANYANGLIKTQIFNQDLDYMKSMGLKKLRLGAGDYNYAFGNAMSKALVLAAKQRGFYVVWGVDVTGGFGAAKDSTWDAFQQGVCANAAWAMANGVDQFQIANEPEYAQTVTHKLTNCVDKMKTLATLVKNNYFSRAVSCSVGQDTLEDEWISKGRGDFDIMGYNVYGSGGDFTDWTNKITKMLNAFGADHFEPSEWNLNSTWSQFPQPESLQATLIAQRNTWLMTSGLKNAYFFNWRWDDNAGLFGLDNNFNFRLWFPSLFTS